MSSVDIHEVKRYIDYHLRELSTVGTLARQLNVSYETLRKCFLRHEHIPLAEYITRRKVEAMQEQLLMAHQPCFYVCLEFGFREDTGAKIFKRITGMTMRQFRKKKMAA